MYDIYIYIHIYTCLYLYTSLFCCCYYYMCVSIYYRHIYQFCLAGAERGDALGPDDLGQDDLEPAVTRKQMIIGMNGCG